MADIFSVRVAKQAQKDLEKIPEHCVIKLDAWIEHVKRFGIRETRKIKSYHDEPLEGKRQDQRSIRLNKAYRAFYIELSDGQIQFISIVEVNKHVYKTKN